MIIKKTINFLHKIYVNQISNLRKVIASTKTKAEVRGGGKKPWKQKGTGNARAGSKRSPIWVGGGITFGPNIHKNYKKKINLKELNLAKLIINFVNNKFIHILKEQYFYNENFYLNNNNNKIEKTISTKYNLDFLKNYLEKLNLNSNKKLLIVVKQNDFIFNFYKKDLEKYLNLKIKILTSNKIKVTNLIKYQQILMTEEVMLDLILVDFATNCSL
jgi:large subunit ribosomal protein L4